MLARVAVDPDAIGEPIAPRAFAKAQHAAILDAINANGSLLFASNEDAMRFAALVRRSTSLPPGVGQKWATALVELNKLGRVSVDKTMGERSLASFDEVDTFKQAWAGRVEVAVFDQRGAEALGVPEDDGFVNFEESDLEVARLFALSGTRAFSHLRTVAETGYLEYDAPREAFWRDVLQPLARPSKVVTILDRYLLSGLWRRNEHRPQSYRWEPEHVVWLLDKLGDAMPAGAQVELLTVVDDEFVRTNKAESAGRLIREFWKRADRGRLGEIRLSVAGDRRNFPHDRHIRFSSGTAIIFGAGLDRLSRPRVWDESGMAWSYKWHPDALRPLREREAQVRDLRSLDTCVL